MAQTQLANNQLTPAQSAQIPLHARLGAKFWGVLATLTTASIGLTLLALGLFGYDATNSGTALVTELIPLYTNIDLGEWAKPEYIDITAGTVAIIVTILLYRLLRQWTIYSGANINWRYYKQLGWKVLAQELWSALLKDSFAVSSVFKHDFKRWLKHGFILYGFTLMTIATTLTFLINYENNPHGFWWFPRILGNTGGLMALIGTTVIVWRLINDPYEDNGNTYAADVTFVVLLYLTILFGFLTEFTLYGLNAPLAYTTFIIHLALVCALFISWPFTRFSHVVLTPYLAYLKRLNQAVQAAQLVPQMQDEPAPGRHVKTERLAADALANLFPEQKNESPTLRYYP